jgi:hypothetical protein
MYDVFVTLTVVGDAVKSRMPQGSIEPGSELLELLQVVAEADLNVSSSHPGHQLWPTT